MRRRIVLHCPEIALKGRNQPEFQGALTKNVRHVIQALGLPQRLRIGSTRGRLHVETTGLDIADEIVVMTALGRVSGISTLGAAAWLAPSELGSDSKTFNWPLVENTVTDMAQAVYEPGKAFAVRVNRVHKASPAGSMEMERRLGQVIRERTGWDRANLTAPDREFHIDVYPDGLYLYPQKHAGVGGLPVGTLGRALALLSGGIDSPVAAFMLAKRGCSVDALHVTSGVPDQVNPEQSQVARIARQLSHFTQRTCLYVVPYLHFDLALRGDRSGFELLLFRRFLLRSADYLAERLHVPAVVMGDSLGQVASQTMENIVTVNAAADRPVLRPLIGFNKQEIIAVARRIGTYDISIEPHKDCCALLSRNPRTRSDVARVEQLEEQVIPDYPALLARTFAETLCLEFDCDRLLDVRRATPGAVGFQPVD